MPPRYSYWTILAGGLPTAFRAAERDELLPTFNRLREKHSDAILRWFARGKLWDSPDAAREHAERAARPARGRDWRPGGNHVDPRQRFEDAKKARNLRARQTRFDRKHRSEEQGPTTHAPRPPNDKARQPGRRSPERTPDGPGRVPRVRGEHRAPAYSKRGRSK